MKKQSKKVWNPEIVINKQWEYTDKETGEMHVVYVHKATDTAFMRKEINLTNDLGICCYFLSDGTEIEWTDKTEKELISGFMKYIKKLDPDFIIGYNIWNFDLSFYHEIFTNNDKYFWTLQEENQAYKTFIDFIINRHVHYCLRKS